MPKTKGAPKYVIECTVLSVNTTISRLVSTAVINSEPVPILKSPAELVASGVHCVKDSELEKRIRRGSCTAVPNVFAPKAIICRELSETITCLAMVGQSDEPVREVRFTALAANPPLLSQ